MNTFGRKFRVSIYGESHGAETGILIDGVPAGMALSPEMFHTDIMRRKSGRPGTTSRIEEDVPQIRSGLYNGCTTGTPLLIAFENKNTRPADYDRFREMPRPGHADFTSRIKYGGFADPRGGGHHSGRLSLPLVAAGVVAKQIILPAKVSAYLLEIGNIPVMKSTDDILPENILKKISVTSSEGDSLGGIVGCSVTGIPAGKGEPFFDSVESLISHIIFSVPAIRGIEFGDGFRSARMKGSEHNDPIIDNDGTTSRNGCGGINGGIANGNDIVFRVAVKPTSSISLSQQTYDFSTGQTGTLCVEGRHDACIALRMPVVIEAVTAIVLADLFLTSPSPLTLPK